MAVSMADITKLRKMTGAGMMDCKNALTDANGDFDQAVKIIREKGQAVAAKRSDRDASEGCVLVKVDGGFGAILALKCETDFVAKNEDFVKLTQDILDLAVANKCQSIEEINALPLGDVTVAQAIIDRSGITGEKMELDGYQTLEGASIAAYNHQSKNFLCTMVALNEVVDAHVGRDVAMQVAAMNPIALNEASVPQAVVDQEIQVAIDKTKVEQVQKAVEAALKKAGFNLYISENEEHLNEGIMKGTITEAQAEEIRQLKAKVAEEKAANMPEAMIEKIAQGRLNKFYKESCLLNQEFIQDGSKTVAEYLKSINKDLTVTGFKRFTLRAE